MQPETLLRERFRLQSFRPGQYEVITALTESGAALAVFPTGGGKSLCYQLPALMFDGVTVVISPLIALMKDQIDALQQLGVAAARLDSSLTEAEYLDVNRRLRAGTLKLLYVAPERFNNERFLEQLGQTNIALLAIDEAHCISEWGHNFRPDYLKLAVIARELGVERVLALTATATPSVVDDICASFRIPRQCAIITGFYRPNLLLSTTPVANERRDQVLLERLSQRTKGPGIVYVTLQKTAERVANILDQAGAPARPYHAGMEDAERVAVQEWWKASSDAIVVATIAFGMGIDKADVRYVYHYNLPKSLENYLQEIGRAGRDGALSMVEVLGSLEDLTTLENFVYGDTPTAESLYRLISDVLNAGPSFDLGIIELSNRYDIRPLVLRTALTHLELLGLLKQGTPFYASYKVRPLVPLETIMARFAEERRQFLQDIFANAYPGRTWYTMDLTQLTEQIGQDRQRIIRALDYLGEQGLAEVKVSNARQRYTRLVEHPNIEDIARTLGAYFTRREAYEIARLQKVIELVSHTDCQTNLLLRYFGEERQRPCGHCSFCKTGLSVKFPPVETLPPIAAVPALSGFHTLCKTHPEALGHLRQQARFLCGLTSPALTRAKLSRHEHFGLLGDYRFRDVLQWCEEAASGA
jgi:ATP-dependent DNA helicase RecQ